MTSGTQNTKFFVKSGQHEVKANSSQDSAAVASFSNLREVNTVGSFSSSNISKGQF